MVAAYFDCQFGAAGDMLVASLIDAGVNFEEWSEQIGKIALPPGSFSVRVEKVIRCTISSTKLHVDVHADHLRAHTDRVPEHHHHHHPHESSEHITAHYSQAHVEELHQHHREQNEAFDESQHHHGRTPEEIREIISRSAISDRAKDLSTRIFDRLARAEAKVHGTSIKEVHFHEVGGIDAIVDIVGFAIAYEMLGITESFVSATPVGKGHIQTEHGLLPIPAPAVVNLLTEAGVGISQLELSYECLTPTGAAILGELNNTASSPTFSTLSNSGYGAGTKNPAGWPNVCRVLLGQMPPGKEESRFDSDVVYVVETNIDDMTPQGISAFVDLCFERGALDASVTSCTMKKGRSGHLITILCRQEDRSTFEELVIVHTTSLGARSYRAERRVANRRIEQVTLDDNWQIGMKVGTDKFGRVVNTQVEFDDCAAYAKARGIPFKDAQQKALNMFEAATKLMNSCL